MTATAAKTKPVRRTRVVPRDVATAAKTAGWRDDFAWPVLHSEADRVLRNCGLAQVRHAATFRDEGQKALFLSAGYWLAFYASSALEVALEVVAARRTAVTFADPSPEFRYLAGDGDVAALPPAGSRVAQSAGKSASFQWLRDLQTTFGMGGVGALLASARSDVTVVGRNPSLDRFVERSPRRVRYVSATSIYERAKRVAAPRTDQTDAVVDAIAALWTDPKLDDGVQDRLHALIVREGRPWIGSVAADLAALRGAPKLPTELWSPTGSKYLYRLIGVAAMQRGGRVVRFGHGGETAAFKVNCEALARRELQVSTEFVLPTPLFADRLRPLRPTAPDFVPGEATLGAGQGDPSMANVAPTAPRAGVPRVLYVAALYRRDRQYLSATPPGTVYLDWQVTLLDALQRTGAEVTCKLHPRDSLTANSPLAGYGALLSQPFHETADQFDVLVFDHLNSSAFAAGLCTSKRVVFLPLTPGELFPEFQHALAQRCRIVDVRYDDDNRIRVDQAALTDAVLGMGSCDGSYFQQLMAEPRPAAA